MYFVFFYLIGFVGVDVYFLIKMKATDLYFYSPIPISFSITAFINTIFFMASIIMKNIKEGDANCNCCTDRKVLGQLMMDYVVVMTVTTLPLFLIFHGFWLFIAAVAYPGRVAASAVFYTPLLSVLILYTVTFGNIISICCKCCQGSDNDEINLKTFCFSLAPIVFVPFWALFLATLYIISDFTLRFGDVSEHSWTAILVALAVIASAHALAKQCVTEPSLSNRNTE